MKCKIKAYTIVQAHLFENTHMYMLPVYYILTKTFEVKYLGNLLDVTRI
jgi:hypothetical protein